MDKVTSAEKPQYSERLKNAKPSIDCTRFLNQWDRQWHEGSSKADEASSHQSSSPEASIAQPSSPLSSEQHILRSVPPSAALGEASLSLPPSLEASASQQPITDLKGKQMAVLEISEQNTSLIGTHDYTSHTNAIFDNEMQIDLHRAEATENDRSCNNQFNGQSSRNNLDATLSHPDQIEDYVIESLQGHRDTTKYNLITELFSNDVGRRHKLDHLKTVDFLTRRQMDTMNERTHASLEAAVEASHQTIKAARKNTENIYKILEECIEKQHKTQVKQALSRFKKIKDLIEFDKTGEAPSIAKMIEELKELEKYKDNAIKKARNEIMEDLRKEERAIQEQYQKEFSHNARVANETYSEEMKSILKKWDVSCTPIGCIIEIIKLVNCSPGFYFWREG